MAVGWSKQSIFCSELNSLLRAVPDNVPPRFAVGLARSLVSYTTAAPYWGQITQVLWLMAGNARSRKNISLILT